MHLREGSLKTYRSDKDFKNKQQLGFSLYEYVTKRKRKNQDLKQLNIIQSQFLLLFPSLQQLCKLSFLRCKETANWKKSMQSCLIPFLPITPTRMSFTPAPRATRERRWLTALHTLHYMTLSGAFIAFVATEFTGRHASTAFTRWHGIHSEGAIKVDIFQREYQSMSDLFFIAKHWIRTFPCAYYGRRSEEEISMIGCWKDINE